MNEPTISTSDPTAPQGSGLEFFGEVVIDARPPEIRARILGTGIEVWEVVRNYLEVGRDWERLRAGLHWLTDEQLRSALDYARQHPEPINTYIQENYAGFPEDLRPNPPVCWP